MKSARGSTGPSGVIRVAMVLVVAAAVVAWLAVGDMVGGSTANHRAASAALGPVIVLAESVDLLADQLQNSVDALVVGTGSAAEAMTHAGDVSQDVQRLLEMVHGLDPDGSDDTYTEIQTSLAEAKASLLENQGGLDETQQALTSTQPVIQSAITALAAIPDQLRAVQADLAAADGSFDNQLGLWRTAILLLAIAMLAACWVIDRIARAQP